GLLPSSHPSSVVIQSYGSYTEFPTPSGGVADLLVPVRLRRDLVAAGRAMAHHTLPHSGWISVRLRSEHDVPNAIALFRLNYERLTGVVMKKAPTSQILPNVTLLADRSIDDLPA
ncbi:MAG: DUF5519 family protein, partial [Gemmatimonadaceae bacterium]|nr:DUF5519 family protein [Gemmatimonadaceae bacterium]